MERETSKSLSQKGYKTLNFRWMMDGNGKHTNNEHPNHRAKLWSKEEDSILISSIQSMKRSCWKKVSDALGGKRSPAQCCQRWHRVLSPKVKQSHWTSQDDQLLIYLVSTYGSKAWPFISERLTNKSELQCRLRFYQVMRRMDPVFHSFEPVVHSATNENPLCCFNHSETKNSQDTSAIFFSNPMQYVKFIFKPSNTPDINPLPLNQVQQLSSSSLIPDSRMSISFLTN